MGFTLYHLTGQISRNKAYYMSLHPIPPITHLKIFIHLGELGCTV